MKNLSYACGVSTEPLIGATIGDIFDETVSKFPNTDALVSCHQNIRWSYAELKEQVETCAKALMHLGLKKGERLGVWSPNCAEWLVVQLATSKIGAIQVNINPSYRIHELEYALSQSGCAMVIIAAKFKTSDYVQMIQTLVPGLSQFSDGQMKSEKLPNLRKIISLGEEAHEGIIPWANLKSYGDLVSNDELHAVQATLSFEDPINIQYTSGTTGNPKGATLSHHNLINNAYFAAKNMRFTNKDKLVIPIPLYHCFGMVNGNLGCIVNGATMVYPSNSFNPELVLKAIQDEKATAIYGVPTMFFAELNHPNFNTYDVSSLRTGITAGSICPEELMKRINADMNITDMMNAYGMTETSPASIQTKPDAPFEKLVSSVGTVLPHTEIKIINPDTGQVVPIGESGELCVRGYCVMLGYWNDEKKTAEAIDDRNWMHTGDISEMDEDGYVNIVGRIKDMIIRGGENIYPKEVEELLYKHPKIKEVQVVGIPSDKFGEEVCAWIQLKDDEVATTEEIKLFCKEQISYFKIPEFIRFTDSFPMTVTGKIRKVEMRNITIEEMKAKG